MRGHRVVVLGLVGALCLVLVAGLTVAALTWWRGRPGDLERAVSLLPESTRRVSWTDWDEVASLAGGTRLPGDESGPRLDAFLDRAFAQGLTAASALTSSAAGLAEAYRVSPLDAEWEAYGQGDEGAVDLLRLSDEVDLGALEDRFAALGYAAPASGPGTSGVWTGTPELVTGRRVPLGPLQENVAVVASQRLLLMSDSPDYLSTAVSVVSGDEGNLASSVRDLVRASGEPSVAVLWAGDLACADLALSRADPRDRAEGERLVERTGGVHPLTGLVMAQQPDDSLVVSLGLASDEQAAQDLRPRTELASGPAPGQGGSFPERFAVSAAVTDGPVVRLTLDPRRGPLLSDLGQGPVLFATC